jgi:hypothetical protein
MDKTDYPHKVMTFKKEIDVRHPIDRFDLAMCCVEIEFLFGNDRPGQP